jgi:hypothetical protein
VERAVERGGAADDAEGEEKHGKKGEEHVEGDGLAESDAVWKDAAQAAEEIFEYSLHEVVGGIIRLVTANRANYLRGCESAGSFGTHSALRKMVRALWSLAAFRGAE